MSYREAVTKPSPGLPRFGGYPGYEAFRMATPTGLVSFSDQEVVGLRFNDAAQPWAELHNRFAVDGSELDQPCLYSVLDDGRKITD
jgi:hypothetical protein